MKNNETSSVTFVAIGGEINDHTNSIIANRPDADNVIVLANPEEHSSLYKVSSLSALIYPDLNQEQTQILGCGKAGTCSNVLNISQTRAVDIESRVSRSSCYERVFASSLSCNGKL